MVRKKTLTAKNREVKNISIKILLSDNFHYLCGNKTNNMHAIILISVAVTVFMVVWKLRNEDFFNDRFSAHRNDSKKRLKMYS